MKAVALTVITIASNLGMFVSPVRAAHEMAHIDEVAYELRGQAAELYREVYYHFRETPHYRHLLSDSYEMYRLADHVHDVAHRADSLRHLKSDVRELKGLVKHFDELVHELEHDDDGHGHGHSHGRRDALQSLRLGSATIYFGPAGLHGYRPVSNTHVKHLRKLLDGTSDMVEHLERDIRRLEKSGHRDDHHRPLPPLPGTLGTISSPFRK